ncbi:MAG: hypothetical protein WBR13_12440 [Allosphingosinicella sp.]
MRPLRSALLKHPLLAVAIGLAGLILRLAVPAGFMPVLNHGQLSLAICSGSTAAAQSAHRTISPLPATEHHDRTGLAADGSCAFADLAVPLTGGADSVRLTAALLFIIAAALFFGTVSPPRAALRLRPPLRGPPLPA